MHSSVAVVGISQPPLLLSILPGRLTVSSNLPSAASTRTTPATSTAAITTPVARHNFDYVAVSSRSTAIRVHHRAATTPTNVHHPRARRWLSFDRNMRRGLKADVTLRDVMREMYIPRTVNPLWTCYKSLARPLSAGDYCYGYGIWACE